MLKVNKAILEALLLYQYISQFERRIFVMEEKSIILDLFNENVSFAERVHPKNTDYHSKAGMAERKLE